MAQVFVIGTVAADLELRISTRKVPYIRFAISERIGYGETGSRQYYQVWAFGSDAEWLARKNVKKGSLLWISGQLRLVDCLEPDGNAGKVLKITFKDGDYQGGYKYESEEVRRRPSVRRFPGLCLPAVCGVLSQDRGNQSHAFASGRLSPHLPHAESGTAHAALPGIPGGWYPGTWQLRFHGLRRGKRPGIHRGLQAVRLRCVHRAAPQNRGGLSI